MTQVSDGETDGRPTVAATENVLSQRAKWLLSRADAVLSRPRSASEPYRHAVLEMKRAMTFITASHRRPLARAVAGVLVACVVLLAAAPASAQIAVRLATMVPDNSSWSLVLKQMAAEWTKASSGKVKLTIYFVGTRGDEQNVVSDMRTGALNAAVLTSAGVAELDKSVYALSIPMAFDSYEEGYAVLEKMRPQIEGSLDAKGFVVLNWIDAGWIHFFSKKSVATPDDLKKLVLFQWQGDPKSLAIWQAAGFNPRAGASSELLSGLKTGMYEALSAPPQVASLLRDHVNAPFMTNLNWAVLLGATVVTKDRRQSSDDRPHPRALRRGERVGPPARSQRPLRRDEGPV